MTEETQEIVIATAREACKKHHDGELKYYKTMAIYVKEQLDKKLGPSWHLVVGKLHLFTNMENTKGSYVDNNKLFILQQQVLTLAATVHTRPNLSTYSGSNTSASSSGNTDERPHFRLF